MRILIIEDNPRMAQALQAGLREHGFAADMCHSGYEAEDLVTAADYDVLLLDLMLPDRDGIELCRNLRRRGVKTKILVLSALNTTSDKVDGLNAGADDYLSKPFEFDELVARLRALLRRGDATEARYLRCDDLELDLYSRTARRGERKIDLSNKEFALLEYLMRSPNRVLSRTQIGEKVWDLSFEPNSNVVDVYISALRRKIDRGLTTTPAAAPATALIHTIKGVGYRFGVME